MKHLIILGDGMADWHLPQLGGKTLLQHAHTPHFDRLAREGRNGLLKTVPDGFHPGSEVANSSILGYDQHIVYEGRGPLEAASIGVELEPGDLALRCNLVCLEGDLLKNHSCGRLETEEGDVLIRFLQAHLGSERVHFYTGVQYRHLLVIKGGDKRLRCTPPHDIPGKPFRDYMLQADVPEAQATAELLTRLVWQSQELLKNHPLNLQRMAQGQDPANSIWPWSGGYRPHMLTIQQMFPQVKEGSVISAVDLIRGIGKYAGLKRIIIPGMTGLANTDYEGKAQAALQALKEGDDFVFLHVEASDEAGHDGDLELKLQTIRNLDERLIRPILEETDRWDEPVCIALLPDHPTPVEIRTHVGEAVPFAIWHRGFVADKVERYDEVSCVSGSYGLLKYQEFMRLLMSIN